MTQSEILFQEWEKKHCSLAEHLGALHSSSSYRALVSSSTFYCGKSLEAVRDLEKLFKGIMGDYAEFLTWMDRVKVVRARSPGIVGALMTSRNVREEELRELLEGASIQLALKGGGSSLLDPALPQVHITPQQLWSEIWRQLKQSEQAIKTLEEAQIKLNQELASIEALLANFREELRVSLQRNRPPIEVDDSTSPGPVPTLEQAFPKELGFVNSMETWLQDRVTRWGRDPLAPAAWTELKEARQQITVQRDRLAEECAARVFVVETLAEGEAKLNAASTRWTELASALSITGVKDPENPTVLPNKKSIEALKDWLEKLRQSSQTHPIKRVAKALRVWLARLQEFEYGLINASENLEKAKRGYSDMRGLYKALLVKSQSKGLTDRTEVAEMAKQLNQAFSARTVDLDHIRRLMKNFVEILC